MGTRVSEYLQGTFQKIRLTPGKTRDTLPNIGGNSNPLLTISNGTSISLDHSKKSKTLARLPRVPLLVHVIRNINARFTEGESQTQ